MFENLLIFGRSFSLYQITATLGVLAAGFYACRRAKRDGLDDNDMILFLLAAGLGVVLGGHLLYGLTQLYLLPSLFHGMGWRAFFTSVYALFGGSVFYGGLLGGMATGLIYLKWQRAPMGAYADIMAPAVPLFHVFGRIGCFLSGCCYGVPCKFGVTYHHALIDTANGVQRFPVQLLEAVFNLALFALLHGLRRRSALQGRLLCLYLTCYAAGRFLLEFLRGDDYRGFFWGLSTSQWVSLLLLPCALVAFFLLGRRRVR